MRKSENHLPHTGGTVVASAYHLLNLHTLHLTQSRSLSLPLADDNWGLPLAIATKLQLPYRIEIGSTIRDLHTQDNPGRGTYIERETPHTVYTVHLSMNVSLRPTPPFSNYYYGASE